MNSVLYVVVALALALVVALGAVLSPRCTSETHNVKVGGMLLAGCER
jgi:hypothetical protein